MARSTFRSQNAEAPQVRTTFGSKRCFVWQAQWILHLVTSEPNVWVLQQCGFCNSFKNDGKRGTFEEDLDYTLHCASLQCTTTTFEEDLDYTLHCASLQCTTTTTTSTNTSSTAQSGGGSFKNRKPKERLVVVNHGWQSESTDGPKGGWSCVFGVVAMAQWSPHHNCCM